MWSEQGRFRVAKDVTYQSMGPGQDTAVLSLSSGYLYTCNETTASFLQELNGRRTLAEVANSLADRYEITPEQLQADLSEILDELVREKLVVPAGAEGD